jgi:hypothetical protein
MPEFRTEEACDELISSEGWLAAISLSIITFGVIFIVGVLVLPEDDNLNGLLWAGGLIVASKVIVSWFPGQLSFRNPSFRQSSLQSLLLLEFMQFCGGSHWPKAT